MSETNDNSSGVEECGKNLVEVHSEQIAALTARVDRNDNHLDRLIDMVESLKDLVVTMQQMAIGPGPVEVLGAVQDCGEPLSADMVRMIEPEGFVPHMDYVEHARNTLIVVWESGPYRSAKGPHEDITLFRSTGPTKRVIGLSFMHADKAVNANNVIVCRWAESMGTSAAIEDVRDDDRFAEHDIVLITNDHIGMPVGVKILNASKHTKG